MMMQKLTIIFFAAMTAVPALAGLAGKESGGGDPLAVEFLSVGRRIEKALTAKKVPGVDEDGSQVKARLDSLQQSLDGNEPRLVFPAGEVVDCFGVPKIGCADTQAEKISVARNGFRELSPKQKIELVALEVFALMKVAGRYEKAGLVSAYLTSKKFQPIKLIPGAIYRARGARLCEKKNLSMDHETGEWIYYYTTVDGSTCENENERGRYKIDANDPNLWWNTEQGEMGKCHVRVLSRTMFEQRCPRWHRVVIWEAI